MITTSTLLWLISPLWQSSWGHRGRLAYPAENGLDDNMLEFGQPGSHVVRSENVECTWAPHEVEEEGCDGTSTGRDIRSVSPVKRVFQVPHITRQPTLPFAHAILGDLLKRSADRPGIQHLGKVDTGGDRKPHRASHSRVHFHEHRPPRTVAPELHHGAAIEARRTDESFGRLAAIPERLTTFTQD